MTPKMREEIREMIREELDKRFPGSSERVKQAERIISRHLESGVTLGSQILKVCRAEAISNPEIKLAMDNLRIQTKGGHWRHPKTPSTDKVKTYVRNLLKDGPVSSTRMRKTLHNVPTGSIAKLRKQLGIKTAHINGERHWVMKDHNEPKVKERSPTERAREFLREALRYGPTTPDDLFHQAPDLSMDNLYAARKDIGVQTTRINGIRHWVLPGGETTDPRSEAASFLRDALKDGPVTAIMLNRMARSKDIPKTTLNRARDQLKIQVVFIGDVRHWQLP